MLAARTFVSLESHCVQECPVVKAAGFQFHHFYYGLLLFSLSLIVLVRVHRVRIRWDGSLFFGIGIGLMADETGLLFLGVTYDSPTSFFIVSLVVGALGLASLGAASARGTREFRLLDRADVLTIASVILAITGSVYFDRPLQPGLEILGGLSWIAAVVLFAVYGRTHLRRILSR